MRTTTLVTLSLSLLLACNEDPETTMTPAAKNKNKGTPGQTMATATTPPVDPDRPAALTADNPTPPEATEEVEEVPAATAGDTECASNLAAIQSAQKGNLDMGYEPAPISTWTPDDSPSASARAWVNPMEFEDTWSAVDGVYGSYKVTVNGMEFTAQCKTDLDGDGVAALWEIGASGEPARTTAEGIR